MRKIGFCSTWPATDPNANSGYAYSMRQQLRQRYEVIDLLLQPRWPRSVFLPLKIAARARGRFYGFEREPLYLSFLSRRMKTWAEREGLAAVVCPTTLPVSRYRGPVPVVVVADQVFPGALGSYLTHPDPRYRRLGLAQERDAMARCAAASFPSRDAVTTAIGECGADPARVHEIPWGANLPAVPDHLRVERAVHSRSADVCSLVFIGREWERKRGNLVLAAMEQLRGEGVPCELTVVGTTPDVTVGESVTVIPFLDKHDPEGRERFSSILESSHFLFVPSRAEAWGQVYCEAAAFGVPSVASAVGGVTSIVRDGETGILLGADATPGAYASRIAALWRDRQAYERMALAARADFETRLNWGTFADRLSEVIERVALPGSA